MHTPLFWLPFSGPPLPSPKSCRASLLISGCIVLWMMFSAHCTPAYSQPQFDGVGEKVSTNFRIYPTDFWGIRTGPGVGAGVVVHNLTRTYDQWLLTAAPALHEQVATLSYASANPQRARRYVLVDMRGMHTDRDWIGPSSSGNRVTLERSSFRSRIRVGQTVLSDRLLLQPTVVVSHHSVAHVREGDLSDTVPPGIAPSSILPPSGSAETGLRLGGDVRLDTRERPHVTAQGLLLQGSWDRYVSIGGSSLQFDQVDLDGYAFFTLSGQHRIVNRVSVTRTWSRSDAPVPAYMLPTLGGTVAPGWPRSRFVAPDRFVAGTIYRFPLRRFGNLASIEGHVGAHLAGVYASLPNQFTPNVSFDEELPPETTVPLRPSASIGVRLMTPFRDQASVDLALGISPEGVAAAEISFVRALQNVRAPHHRASDVR